MDLLILSCCLLLSTHSLPASWERVRVGVQQGCHSNGISPQSQKRQELDVFVCAIEQVLCRVCFCFASSLCKYDLREGDLFVPSWDSVRRVCLGSVSSVLFSRGLCSLKFVNVCGGCMR